MNVPSSWILSGNGSDQMLGFLIQYYGQGNKTLYTLAPDFSMYDYYVELNHAKIEKFETSLDGSFDVDAFISNGKDKKVDMILFDRTCDFEIRNDSNLRSLFEYSSHF